MSSIVLLSTFNGERDLASLIDSISAQAGERPRILVRDDGSSDRTGHILAEYTASGIIELIDGQAGVQDAREALNCGAKDSFLKLLRSIDKSDSGIDAVFFADQDDLWNVDKLKRARSHLAQVPEAVPALYFARVEILAGDSTSRGFSPVWPRKPSFANALVENVAMGCTIAMNRPAAELICAGGLPEAAIMHDWWCYLVVSAFGKIIFDPTPVLRYKLHSNNLVGLATNRVEGVTGRIAREVKTPIFPRIVAQAAEFKSIYGDRLRPDQIALIDRLLATETFAGRIAFATDWQLYRQYKSDDMALRLLALTRGA